jgi:hypothetical protein
MPDAPHPFDQQPGEPILWFARFEAFRRLGPGRSILAVYNAEPGKARKGPADSAPGAWKQAAAEWRWSERAEAWDQAQLRTARDEESEALAEMRRRHMAAALGAQGLAGRRLGQMLERAKAEPLYLEGLSVRDLLALFEFGLTQERLARGEPTSISEQRDGAAREAAVLEAVALALEPFPEAGRALAAKLQADALAQRGAA